MRKTRKKIEKKQISYYFTSGLDFLCKNLSKLIFLDNIPKYPIGPDILNITVIWTYNKKEEGSILKINTDQRK